MLAAGTRAAAAAAAAAASSATPRPRAPRRARERPARLRARAAGLVPRGACVCGACTAGRLRAALLSTARSGRGVRHAASGDEDAIVPSGDEGEGDSNGGGEVDSDDGGDGDVPVPTRAALAALGFYRREISPLLPRACRYVPSCSEYSIECYTQYGVCGFDPPRVAADKYFPPGERDSGPVLGDFIGAGCVLASFALATTLALEGAV